jgi:hypothetical protein
MLMQRTTTNAHNGLLLLHQAPDSKPKSLRKNQSQYSINQAGVEERESEPIREGNKIEVN